MMMILLIMMMIILMLIILFRLCYFIGHQLMELIITVLHFTDFIHQKISC